MNRWAVAGFVFVLASLVLGYLVAGQIDSFLYIQYNYPIQSKGVARDRTLEP